MESGTVKWFNNDKGFGFITPDNSSTDIFVHYSGIKSEGYRGLKENQKVNYDVEDGPKGPQATNVTVV